MRLSALIVLILAMAAFAQDPPKRKKGNSGAGRYKSLKDQQAPEIVSIESDWLYTKKPLTLKDLKGLVVVLEFSNHT